MIFIYLLILQEFVTGFNASEFHPNNTLRVAALPSAPFTSRNKEGQFIGGIEFDLLKTIAKRENLKLSIESYETSDEFIQHLRYEVE